MKILKICTIFSNQMEPSQTYTNHQSAIRVRRLWFIQWLSSINMWPSQFILWTILVIFNLFWFNLTGGTCDPSVLYFSGEPARP